MRTMCSSSEFQLLQDGGWHWLPWCGHQLGARWSIVENVTGSAYEISASSMLIKSIRSIKMFSTGLTHRAEGVASRRRALLCAGTSTINSAMTRSKQQTKSRKIKTRKPSRIWQNGESPFQVAAPHFCSTPKFNEYKQNSMNTNLKKFSTKT